MKKLLLKLLTLVLGAIMVLASVACGGNKGDSTGGSSGGDSSGTDNGNTPVQTEALTKNVEKDFVYLTYGQKDEEAQTLSFQGPSYLLRAASHEGTITGFAPISYSEKHYVAGDFDNLPAVNTKFYMTTDKGLSTASGVQTVQSASGGEGDRYWRLLEGGRYKQKVDVPKLVYDKESDIYGRMEINAYQNSFSIGYDVFSPRKKTNVVLSFEITSDTYVNFKEDENGRFVTLTDGNGDGLAIVLPDNGAVQAEAVSGGVKLTYVPITVTANKLAGFAVNAVPVKGGDLSGVNGVIAREGITATVTRTMPEVDENITTKYDESIGTLLIDGNIKSGLNYLNYNVEQNLNAYDRFEITLTNDGNEDVVYPLSVMLNTAALNSADNYFGTNANFGMVGVSSFITDKNGMPIGKPVQVSKNWHSFDPASNIEKVACTYTGQWYVGTVYLDVPAGETVEYTYTSAYAYWGEAPSVSHSQLSLVGWGGYDLWEQLALANYGENICYAPNGNSTGSWGQDIRPFEVTNKHGQYVKYSWSGNTGGLEFLRYYDYSERNRYLVDTVCDYRSQGPNMTETDWNAFTSDGKMHMSATSNLVRTDDVTRILYNIRYTFVEEVRYTRLTLFQYNTDRYQNNYFKRYAYGNSQGVIKDEDRVIQNEVFGDSAVAQQLDVTGDDQWFYLYDFDFEKREETNGVAFIVRDYKASLNGAEYTDPTVNFRSVGGQLTYELTAPKAVGKTINKGGYIDMCIELVVLPNNAEYYYGDCEYLLAGKNSFNTASQALEQAVNGKVTASATVGRVTANYPVTVACESGATAAEISLTGGLGYVPVKFTGLESYCGYKLQVKADGVWTDVDQSVKGNDFWQCGYDYATGSYYLVYNVKNTVGTSFLTTNSYRLVRI